MSDLHPAIQGLIAGGVLLGALSGLVAYVTLLERKFAARMQSRIGPYRVGPHGLLQPIADAVSCCSRKTWSRPKRIGASSTWHPWSFCCRAC